ELKAQTSLALEPGGAALKERAVNLDLLVRREPVPRAVRGHFDARDRVVGLFRLVIDPALNTVVDARDAPGLRERGLRSTQRQPASAGQASLCRKPIEQRSPAAADVEHVLATDGELARKEIQFPLLRGFESLVRIVGIPERTRVHQVVAQPDRKEVVGEIVVT